jgi:conjugal transfer pilus assembly protein TrbC
MTDIMMIPAFTGTLACWVGLFGLLIVALTALIVGFRLQWITIQLAGCVVAGAGVLWAATPASAQDELGAAARALIDQAEARGRSAQEALAEWTARAGQAGAQYQEEARELAARNEANIARGMTMLRDDPTFGDAARAMAAPSEEGGAVYVAVSLTMPRESLRQLATDAHRAGAKVVIRGLVNGSFDQTLVAAKEVFGEDAVSGVAIEPQVFRAFGIERVPAFIAATAPVEPCDQGIDCTSAATPHDRLAGNITLAEALRIIAERGDQAPDVARAALERLEG